METDSLHRQRSATEITPSCGTPLMYGALQWGRRLSAAEILGAQTTDRGGNRASMGPPPFSGGNGDSCPGAFGPYRCFNGAAAFQRRKCSQASAARISFFSLQWGRRLSAAEILLFAAELVEGNVASMGPPPFSGGNKPKPGRKPTHYLASMGPPPFSGGNVLSRWQSAVAIAASMGPPPFSGGNQIIESESQNHEWLQWGRRLSAAEMFVRACGVAVFHGLQWGRRLSAAEILLFAAELVEGNVASMGPPPFSGGNKPKPGRKPTHYLASMGPPPFSGGNNSVDFH